MEAGVSLKWAIFGVAWALLADNELLIAVVNEVDPLLTVSCSIE
jgi:hypothetical protein